MASRLFSNSQLFKTVTGSFRRYTSASSSAREKYLSELEHTRAHAKEATELWRKISIYICGPILTLATYNAYRLATEHEHHLAEHPLEHEGYHYLRIRKKPFPFGDGDHTLFHNPKVNIDP